MKDNSNINKNIIYKFQKPVIFMLFFVMILLFVYSLIFFTPFYDLYGIDSSLQKDVAVTYGVWYDNLPEDAYTRRNGKLFGYNLSYFTSFTKTIAGQSTSANLQTYNHFLFNFGFIGILLSAISFIFYSQKRKIFYPTNFVFLGLSSAYGIGISIFGMINLKVWDNYLKNSVRYDIINAYQSFAVDETSTVITEYFSYSKMQWIFIVGYILFAIIIIASIIGLIYLVARMTYQKKNPPMDLSEVNIDE